MNVEEQYRTTLDELTRDRVGGPDLAAAIAGGRRRRRVRRTAWAGGACLAVASVATVAGVALTSDGSTVAVEPVPSSMSYRDFVAGTDIDESVQATVAQHLSGLAAATDVYPSDWNTSGPIPDAGFADATEWHAVYDVSGDEKLTVLMSHPIPGEGALPGCEDVQQVDLPCRRTEGADGSLDMEFGTVINGSTYRFLTVHVTAGGFVTEALDDVQAGSWGEARAARQLGDAPTKALVQDPALRFPGPVHTPPSPPPQM